MFVRKESTSIGADPTTSVTFTRKTKRLTIYLQEFFGDITCRIYWRGHSILFTSDIIHPLLNKIATKKFNALEDATAPPQGFNRHGQDDYPYLQEGDGTNGLPERIDHEELLDHDTHDKEGRE